MNADTPITLTLPLGAIPLVLTGLNQLPRGQVDQLFNDIQKQAEAQTKALVEAQAKEEATE